MSEVLPLFKATDKVGGSLLNLCNQDLESGCPIKKVWANKTKFSNREAVESNHIKNGEEDNA